MRVLITGNMGYVGPVAVKHLREQHPEWRLLGYDAGYMAHCLTGAGCLPERYLDVQYFGDVRNLGPEALEGVDAVVHLAAISNDPLGKAYEDVTHEVNWRAAVRIAELARAGGAKHFVFASSCSIYGAAETPRDEQAELNPLTAYARSKVQAESDLSQLANSDFSVTSLRFPTACGMSDRLRLDLVLNDFVASALATGRIQILSDGTPWRPLINVKDMARAMDWALQRQRGGAFLAVNVGRTDWNYQVRDLAEAVADQIPGTDIDVNSEAMPDKRSYRVDFSLYKDLAPGFLPVVPLEGSIEELAVGLQRMGFSDGEFRQGDFMRLRVLSGLQEKGYVDGSLLWQKIRPEEPVPSKLAQGWE